MGNIAAPQQGFNLDHSKTSSLGLHFKSLLPAKPYCTDYPGPWMKIRDRDDALKRRYIQYNGPANRWWLIFDIDRWGAATAFRDACLPPPNIIIENPYVEEQAPVWWADEWTISPANKRAGHAHYAYRLETPVYIHNGARAKPQVFCEDVTRGMANRLGADRYKGWVIAKNPLHPSFNTLYLTDHAYSLKELDEHLLPTDKGTRKELIKPQPLAATVGFRHNTLFQSLRRVAYRRFNCHNNLDGFIQELIEISHSLNTFEIPLPVSELRHTARAIAKWVWKRFEHVDAEEFSERQRWRVNRRWNKSRIKEIDALEAELQMLQLDRS